MSKLDELEKLADEASERTPGEWGKGEGYYGFIDRSDGRYFCTLHNNIKQLIALCRTMRKAFDAWPHHFTSANAIKEFDKFNGGDGC